MSIARKKIWLPDDGSAPITLGDDFAGDYITETNPPAHTRAGAVAVPLLGADYEVQLVLGGDNRVDEVIWRVNRRHVDADTAFLFSRQHHGLVPTAGTLQDGGVGLTTLFLLDANIQTRCVFWEGATTIFEYTVRGGPWSIRGVTPP